MCAGRRRRCVSSGAPLGRWSRRCNAGWGGRCFGGGRRSAWRSPPSPQTGYGGHQPSPWRRLVEAAGVEPASEKVPRRKTTCVSGSVVFVRPIRDRQEWVGLSPIDFGLRLQAEALDLLLQNDAPGPRAGPSARGGYLVIRQRMQTACWQLWFSDRFTGARNPARLPTRNAIPSNPLRPLSLSVYHRG